MSALLNNQCIRCGRLIPDHALIKNALVVQKEQVLVLCRECRGAGRKPCSFVFSGVGTGVRLLDFMVAVPLPAGTAANLRVLLSSVADFPIQFAVIKNGASTALGCDIIAGENSCENLADAVAFDNFDTLSLGIINPIAQPSQPFLKWSLTYGPPSP